MRNPVQNIIAENLADRVLDLAVAIQQIPSPTFAEAERAAFLLQTFLTENLEDVHSDRTGNVYARLAGHGKVLPLIVSAHLDTVFPADTNLAVRRQAGKIIAPGIGDNAMGLAALLGLVWGLRHKQISLLGDIWLVANVCEEGLGNLNGMRAVVEHFNKRVSAYLVLEGMSLGQIYHRGLGVKRYRLTVHTPGGHAWVDYGKPSAVHILAEIIMRLQAIFVPVVPRSSLNVGVISGGTTINTIAAEAYLELDLRSEEKDVLAGLADQVQAIAYQAKKSEQDNIKVDLELIGERTAGSIPVGHPLVQLASRVLEAYGIQPHLQIGSTDANIPLSLGFPSICVGITNGGGAHTISEHILTRPVGQGLAQLIDLVEGIFTQA